MAAAASRRVNMMAYPFSGRDGRQDRPMYERRRPATCRRCRRPGLRLRARPVPQCGGQSRSISCRSAPDSAAAPATASAHGAEHDRGPPAGAALGQSRATATSASGQSNNPSARAQMLHPQTSGGGSSTAVRISPAAEEVLALDIGSGRTKKSSSATRRVPPAAPVSSISAPARPARWPRSRDGRSRRPIVENRVILVLAGER